MSADLFTEMDRAADLLRETNPDLRETLSDELQLEFRQLQKKRMPQLSKGQFLDLFQHGGTTILPGSKPSWPRRASAWLRMIASCGSWKIAEFGDFVYRLANVFICKCGEVIADPFDPKMLELHGPHFQAASLPQVHEALERWRDYARRTVEAASDLGGGPN